MQRATPSMIRADRLTRRFGPTLALDHVSLDVQPGAVFAVVGPDGAGKTTLIRTLCGAIAVDSGEAFVAGIDVRRHPESVQACVGYMPQRFSLYPDLTVIENLRFYADLFCVERAAFTRRSTELLADFALSPFVDRLAEQLSGGMKQKLALACTLIHDPTVLLLDEPTAGVDPVSRREFWRMLFEINRTGTTVFVSTPYMDEAERAQRVAFLVGGQIITCASPEELKGELAGDVVEVLCAQKTRTKSILRDDPTVQSIEVFGESLHALVASARDAIPALQRRLIAAGIRDAQLHEIAPSLEDAFVAKLRSA